MSDRTFNDSTPSIPRSRKMVGVIAGVCVLIVILVAILAYLLKQADFSLIITYLSNIQVTPA